MRAFRRKCDEGEIPLSVMVRAVLQWDAAASDPDDDYASILFSKDSESGKWVGLLAPVLLLIERVDELSGDDLSNWTTALMMAQCE